MVYNTDKMESATLGSINKKIQQLDVSRLQALDCFLDFLINQASVEFRTKTFPTTQILWPNNRQPYEKSLTLEEMDAAIEYESGLRVYPWIE